MRLMIPTSAEMERFGHRCGMVALAGDVVVLTGELGAGKTTFARGFGEALDLDTPVSSPTFIVARTHQRRDPSLPPLVHVDAYRLGSAAELDELDIHVEGSIVLAEWAGSYGETLASSWVEVSLSRPLGSSAHLDTDEPRDVTLQGHGPEGDLLERLAKASEEFHVSGG
jgi:tRNA threonylcarbamoyl adenosine modification protein YjeE